MIEKLARTFLYCILFEFWILNAIPVQKFYPFGTINRDRELPKYYHEVASPEITLNVPIKFYGESYNVIYVNANGLLSFITPFQTFLSMQFPLDYPVIAALYANTDLRSNGNVFYRETQNSDLLARATDEIRHAFPNSASAFTAKGLFIATWLKVGYFDRASDKVNTYQIIIASNGTESFLEFLYADDGIQWLQGHGQPGTGLPDAKAQAGLVALNGRTYILQGSGTDQIRNLVRLSNANEAGVWIFRMGDIAPEANVEIPNISQILSEQVNNRERETSCATGFSLCHSQATCVDLAKKYCCVCRKGSYGNGYNCLKEGSPLRASGKAYIDVNGVKINQLELQAYIVIADGRVYVALSKIPQSLGYNLQLLYPITAMLNWLFAKPIGNGLNGFQITGGVLNHSAEITYKDSGDRIFITQKYFGLDVFDQLKLELYVKGKVPQDAWENKVAINDYQQQFNFIAPGIFRTSSSSLTYIKTSAAQEQTEYQISLEQTVMFNESCSSEFNVSSENIQPKENRAIHSYYRVKTARNFVSYEANENILRFAATSKVSLLTENEDPCIEGHVKCVANSSCVVEGDSFRCLCNPGFQTTYANKYSENGNNEFGCLDVNECTEAKSNCDDNAICVNEIGSHQCVCKPGYSGNGYQCSEVESPCKRHPYLCNPPNSYCSVPSDYHTCDCLSGFQKKYLDEKQIGFICDDVNECELTDACGSNAVCINREGSYRCECRTGYTGNGQHCRQLEDSCNKIQNCSPNGECVYNETSGKYTCRCIRGYYGDGYTCKAYGGRQVVSKMCTANSCVCPPNFIAVDNLCVENSYSPIISEKSSITCNILSNMCHPHAQCVYNVSVQQHQCQCNAGFEGNGLECQEAEISCLKADICDLHATCQVDEGTGKARCLCNSHYQGNGMHCVYIGMCHSDGDCNENEECFYNEATLSYECQCRHEFRRDQNLTCRPVTKCPTCHYYAQCVKNNYNSDSYCQCLPDYTGDGIYACEKITPRCNIINNCSPFAKCEYNATSASFYCSCIKGYAGNGTDCYNIQSCLEVPELCDRNARCISRNYEEPARCECIPGFVGNGSSCTEIPKNEGNFLLVNFGMTTLKLPYEPSVLSPGYPIQMQANQITTGLTIDCLLGKVYWCDYNGRKIKSSTYKGKNISNLVENNISAPEGLTTDWIRRILYWTDSGKRVIEMITLDGTDRKTVISNNLINPRGIAVHPYRRKLFWSDWNRAQPKIEWSNTDGNERSIFLSGPEVQLPNSVTIDFSTDELCWADAGTKRIICANIENKLTRLITDKCLFPFSLAISTEKYFWTDWTSGKIGFYDRRTKKVGNMSLPLSGSGSLYGIVAVPNECP